MADSGLRIWVSDQLQDLQGFSDKAMVDYVITLGGGNMSDEMRYSPIGHMNSGG